MKHKLIILNVLLGLLLTSCGHQPLPLDYGYFRIDLPEARYESYQSNLPYVFDLSNDIKFKPAFLTKVVEGSPLQVDVSANFMFVEKLTLGVAYRWSAAMSTMVGFQVSDGMYIGYGYDLETTNLENYNSGSHEIFLRYEIFKNSNKILTPRFF